MSSKLILQFIVYLLILLTIFIIQTAFLANFSLLWRNLPLVLAVLSSLVYFFDFKKIIIFVLVIGFLFDIYANLFFGVYLLTFFAVAVSLKFIFVNFITNRSFYSFVLLGLLTVIFYNIFFSLINGFMYLIGMGDYFFSHNFWLGLVYQLVNMVVVLSLLFLILKIFIFKKILTA